jgi:flagellar basal-body rod modification protein FlgD
MPNPIESTTTKDRYLQTDKSVNIKSHLQKMEQEEKSGLKGVEVRETAKQLGKDDFLRLLITQMGHQDPTNPLKDQDFIAQMAQFSSLEQMKNISSGIARMEAKQSYSLVGKFVSGPDMVTGETVSGIAGAMFLDAEGKSYLRVSGRTIPVDKVNFISEPSIMDQERTGVTEVLPKETLEQKSEQPSVPKKETNEAENAWEHPGKKSSNQKSYD